MRVCGQRHASAALPQGKSWAQSWSSPASRKIDSLKPFFVVMVIQAGIRVGWYQANAAVEISVILVAICSLGQTSLTPTGVFFEVCCNSTTYGI